MGVKTEIETRLRQAFQPTELIVIDESEQHKGHSGYQDGGESHWRVSIRASAFGEMTRIQRHRAVHDALGKDLVGRIHALALDIGT